MKATVTSSPYSLVAALMALEEIAGQDRAWKATSELQRQFLAGPWKVKKQVGAIHEMQTKASWRADVLNQFLAERGYNIRLGDFSPKEFGAVACMNVVVPWLESGIRSTFSQQGVQYPCFILKTGLVFYKGGGFTNDTPLVCITTKSGDRVWITVPNFVPHSATDLEVVISKMLATKIDARWDGVQIPMVDLDDSPDISWLKGMETTCADGVPAVITQALQQNKLMVNEMGAVAKSAVAVSATRSFKPSLPTYVFDQPFMFWITRKGLSLPLFAAYVTQENWKDPGKIF